MIEPKAAFARRMEVTQGRLSQWVSTGLPVTAEGKVDVAAAAAWLRDNLDSQKGGATIELARSALVHALVGDVLRHAAREIPIAVTLAAPEVGLCRKDAQFLANLACLFWARAIDNTMPEDSVGALLPDPDAWPAFVNWPGLFDEAGQSRSTGAMRAVGAADEVDEAPLSRRRRNLSAI